MIDFDDIVSILKLFGPEGIDQHFSKRRKRWGGFSSFGPGDDFAEAVIGVSTGIWGNGVLTPILQDDIEALFCTP